MHHSIYSPCLVFCHCTDINLWSTFYNDSFCQALSIGCNKIGRDIRIQNNISSWIRALHILNNRILIRKLSMQNSVNKLISKAERVCDCDCLLFLKGSQHFVNSPDRKGINFAYIIYRVAKANAKQ